MTSLDLSTPDLIKVRSSWADVIAQGRHSEDDFINNAFASMLANNAELKQLFSEKAILDEQKYLFKELLKFTMTYLHDEAILNECTDEFIKENPSIVKYGVEYLEPMGGEMISTLRKTLGSSFHSGLETLWIKVYVYIANCILLNDESDVSSVISNTNKSTASEEEIRPLNLNKSPAPLAPETPQQEISGNTIKIDLGGNEKYKGFRRSITESPKAPVLVKVPASFISPQEIKAVANVANRSNSLSPQPSESSLFDPRPQRRRPSMEEPILTPRSSRRNSSAQLQELGLDLEVKESANIHPYDPRRKTSHKRTPSDLSLNMHIPQRLVSTSSSELQVSDYDDEFKLEDEIDFSLTKQRSPVFDHNSFGIKGLAPIAESEHDDERSQYSDRSSNYADNSEKGSDDGYSSRTSSLSLHNLDYKSSISSGSGHSPVIDKGHKSTQSDISFMAPLSTTHVHHTNIFENSPYQNRCFSSSVPSLSSRVSSGQRASLGFMRSSFILKKEMQDLGYNNPENVVVQPQLPIASLSMANVSMTNKGHHSLASLALQRTRSSLQSKNRELPQLPVGAKFEKESTPTPSVMSTTSSQKKKSSFRGKLLSFFGGSSSSSSSKPLKISAPISVPPPPASKAHSSKPVSVKEEPRQSFSRTSTQKSNLVTSNYTRNSNRVSSLDLRLGTMKSPQPGYAGSIHLKTSDSASIRTQGTSKTGFSFFKSEPNVKYPDGQAKKMNKYHVLKVPYKTIYVKDLIRK